MEVTGTLKVKFETQKVSDRFQKRDFVLITEANTPYPQYVSFQVTQDKCNLLDQFSEGEELRVQFNLRGREHNFKFFNTLDAWRIEKVSNQQTNTAAAGNTSNGVNMNDIDDLPF